MDSNVQEMQNNQQEHYEKRHPRINKPDMFMNTALWMELSPLAERPESFVVPSQVEQEDAIPGEQHRATSTKSNGGHIVDQESQKEQKSGSSETGRPVRFEETRGSSFTMQLNKSGAVYVLPNDRALSVDCSQNGVHAAVSALNKFGQERAKGCQVYLSRRPCSNCAKLLVQCEVAKVFYLPIEPEWNDPEDVRRVDNIFKACSTGLSIFIPKARGNIIDEIKKHNSLFLRQANEDEIQTHLDELIKEYWNEKWIEDAGKVLTWPAFTDKMKEQTNNDMRNLLEWITRATFGGVPDNMQFAEIDPATKKAKRENAPTGEEDDGSAQQDQAERQTDIPDIPTPSHPNWQKHALHMCRLAQMLSRRSDDPTRRVGCVLMLRNEVVAIGWNGFPAKSLYGEFPRAASTDRAKEKKEPYVIHAEQNALLTRNKRNLNHDSSILFCNNIPAKECVPVLIQAGVQNVLVPFGDTDKPENKPFFKALEHMKLTGFWPKDETTQAR